MPVYGVYVDSVAVRVVYGGSVYGGVLYGCFFIEMDGVSSAVCNGDVFYE